MQMRLMQAELLTYKSAWMYDNGPAVRHRVVGGQGHRLRVRRRRRPTAASRSSAAWATRPSTTCSATGATCASTRSARSRTRWCATWWPRPGPASRVLDGRVRVAHARRAGRPGGVLRARLDGRAADRAAHPGPGRGDARAGRRDDPELLVGFVPARGRGVSLEKAAINAVMAGCKPEYFPVVVAALEAMFDEAFNLHTVLTSTGGAALCVVVSGPIAPEIGMNARHNVLGQGNRANATIGRALRLVAMNVLGSKPGESDASSFGHPGKFTLCFAEDPPPAPWEPLRVGSATRREDTTVTVVPVEGPHQLAQQLTTRPAECCARSRPRSAPDLVRDRQGRPRRAVLGPEHAGFCVCAGLDAAARARVRLRRAADRARRAASPPASQLEDNAQHDMTRATTASSPRIESPDDVLLVTAGGEGAGWSAWMPAWAPTIHAYRATRRVRPAGEPLPECGPDGCIVPWMHSLMAEITVLRPDEPAPPSRRSRSRPRGALPDRPVIGLVANGKPLAKRAARRSSPTSSGTGSAARSTSSCLTQAERRLPDLAERGDALAARAHCDHRASATEAPARRAVCTTRSMMEQRGTPATVLITEPFQTVVASNAAKLGAPGYHSLTVAAPGLGEGRGRAPRAGARRRRRGRRPADRPGRRTRRSLALELGGGSRARRARPRCRSARVPAGTRAPSVPRRHPLRPGRRPHA